MTSDATGMCGLCGKPGIVHLTEIRDGVKTSRSFCVEHVPPEMRDKMPFGPHRTADDEIDLLRKQISAIDQQTSDRAQRAEYKAEIENLISDIEAGRRRLGDAD